MIDLTDAVREPAAQGKCFDTAMKEVTLPTYESWAPLHRVPAHERSSASACTGGTAGSRNQLARTVITGQGADRTTGSATLP